MKKSPVAMSELSDSRVCCELAPHAGPRSMNASAMTVKVSSRYPMPRVAVAARADERNAFHAVRLLKSDCASYLSTFGGCHELRPS